MAFPTSLFLSLIFASFIFFPLSSVENPHHLMLALQWPESFCNVNPPKCINPIDATFKIHGLWPTRRNGDSIEFCGGVDLKIEDVDDLQAELNVMWPSYTGSNFEFWSHEWKKHGTCSGYTPTEYFKIAMLIFNSLNDIDAKIMAEVILSVFILQFRGRQPSRGLMESCYMPQDVMVDILLRLPIKSLIQFRCVSKYWCAFIKSPSFIRMHLESTGIEDNRLFLMSNVGCKRIDSNLLVSDGNINKLVSLEIPFFMPWEFPNLFGSCNGILALFYTKHPREPIILWNPATREFKVLPLPHLSLYHPSDPEQSSYVPHLGFGFDAKTNDHKVVRILSPGNNIKMVIRSSTGATDMVFAPPLLPLLVEVYTLSNNSWKIKNVEVPSCGFLRVSARSSTYLDGIYYWWVTDTNGQCLLSFDMADEVFQKTAVPDYCAYYFHNILLLSVLKGSIALIAFCVGEDLKCFNVWLLTDKSDENCSAWAKHSTIGPLFGSEALGFWLNGEFLLRSGRKVISYDPDSQVSRDAYVIEGSGFSLQLVLYKESLVALEIEN